MRPTLYNQMRHIYDMWDYHWREKLVGADHIVRVMTGEMVQLGIPRTVWAPFLQQKFREIVQEIEKEEGGMSRQEIMQGAHFGRDEKKYAEEVFRSWELYLYEELQLFGRIDKGRYEAILTEFRSSKVNKERAGIYLDAHIQDMQEQIREQRGISA